MTIAVKCSMSINNDFYLNKYVKGDDDVQSGQIEQLYINNKTGNTILWMLYLSRSLYNGLYNIVFIS